MLKFLSFAFVLSLAFLGACTQKTLSQNDTPKTFVTPPKYGLDPSITNEPWWHLWQKEWKNFTPHWNFSNSKESSLWRATMQEDWWSRTNTSGSLAIELRIPRTHLSKLSLTTLSQWIYFFSNLPSPKKIQLNPQVLVQKLPPLENFNGNIESLNSFEIFNPQKLPLCEYIRQWIHAHQVLQSKKQISHNPIRIHCLLAWFNSSIADASLLPLLRLARLPLPIQNIENNEFLVQTYEDALNPEKLKPILGKQ